MASPDVRAAVPSDPLGDVAVDEQGSDVAPPAEGLPAAEWWRVETRRLLREFLRAVPRTEGGATFALVRLDSTMHLLTRTELSMAIDALRPRQRQIVRLAIEERWPRQRVCAYLNGISEKTLERDQNEALDLLAQL
jgi:hypothetical protein